MLMVVGLAMMLAAPALCAQEKAPGPDEQGYGMMGPGGGMGMGYGRGMGPGGGMGPGCMMDDGSWGWGMHGRGCGYMRPRGWRSMKPEQREKCEKMRAAHLMDTLELRKQLAAKRIELRTLWVQPNVDDKKVEQLADGITDLKAALMKKRDKYLLECRRELGDHGWCCPGGSW
jgi:Spy/CpxP family protein refolding chaperone